MWVCVSSWLRHAASLAAAWGCILTVSPVSAQVPTGRVEAVVTPEEGAQKYFDRALEQYRAGQYSRALASLDEAIKLDPDGKDLFFNLAMVHEKLGQLGEAIAAWRRFGELETDPAERERARLAIERLRGAASELSRPAAPEPCPKVPLREPAPAPRANPVLIGAASLAVVSLAIAAIFGVKALSDDVSNAGTSESLSLGQLRERGRKAEREALIADVAFGVAAASVGTFAGVWWLSASDSRSRAAGITLMGDF
jgi:tetratricopeptide (TPR) repeat protein